MSPSTIATTCEAPSVQRTERKLTDAELRSHALGLLEKGQILSVKEVAYFAGRPHSITHLILTELVSEGLITFRSGYYYKYVPQEGLPRTHVRPVRVSSTRKKEKPKEKKARTNPLMDDSPFTTVEVIIPKEQLAALKAYTNDQMSEVSLAGGRLLSEMIRIFQEENVLPK